MAEPSAWIALVPISESFGTAIAALAQELALGVVEWRPDGGESLPTNLAAVCVLAGGEETAAFDLLPEVPHHGAPVFVFGSRTEHRLATGLLRQGATDYFALPGDIDVARRILGRLANARQEEGSATAFATEEQRAAGFASIVGHSEALRRIIDKASRVAAHADVTLLLQGETGTGKEVLARAIHYHSPRARGPFVEINCAAIPENLLESELFGHERGAFTGAVTTKQGLFELAHGGSLLLDEIGHLPLELQAKLLRVLESREIRRVGGSNMRPIDVRVIAATHVKLGAAVDRGEFREDLFYRLNVVALELPPLRDRGEDVELLAETFVSQLATRHQLPVPPVSPEVRETLRQHTWPGNVRELRNAIERAMILSPPGTLMPEELRLETPTVRNSHDGSGGTIPFPAPLEEITRAAVAAMMRLTDGNKSEAARLLGISRPRLQRWLVPADNDND